MRRFLLAIRQFFCTHANVKHTSGFDWSETTCQDCGLRDAVTGRYYGSDWR